ncbi:MAG: hypothetical protein JSR63_11990 [Proteobacteria bacterium]|nr:hypothetical protein [Pseudomonadota bacterium]
MYELTLDQVNAVSGGDFKSGEAAGEAVGQAVVQAAKAAALVATIVIAIGVMGATGAGA